MITALLLIVALGWLLPVRSWTLALITCAARARSEGEKLREGT